VIVEFLPRARQRIKVVAAWWRKKRTAAPTLFDDELAALIERLKVYPLVGGLYEVVDGGRSERRDFGRRSRTSTTPLRSERRALDPRGLGARRGRKLKL
jgi:hypothetical protein